jgi:hypothetical protein
MRFAWIREKNSDKSTVVQQKWSHPLSLVRIFYNLVFWVFLIPFFTVVEDRVGFLAMAVVIGVRLVLNLVTNNLLNLTPEQFDGYPFRIP